MIGKRPLLTRLLAFLMVREQVDVVGIGRFGADEVAASMLAIPEGRLLSEFFEAAVAWHRAPSATDRVMEAVELDRAVDALLALDREGA